MIISIDDRLDNLYNGLKSMGHQVYKLSQRVTADVVIYSGGNTHISFLNNSPELNSNDRGVFLINGDNRSVEEISSIIKTKTYSSLF